MKYDNLMFLNKCQDHKVFLQIFGTLLTQKFDFENSSLN
jgi:hypothetical protein